MVYAPSLPPRIPPTQRFFALLSLFPYNIISIVKPTTPSSDFFFLQRYKIIKMILKVYIKVRLLDSIPLQTPPDPIRNLGFV